jgi:hypothetical protein
VVDIYSEEEEAAPNTSRDEDIARKIFGDFNHGLFGHLAMTTLSSSVTLRKKKMSERMTMPTSMPCHFLLGTPRLHQLLPPSTMTHSMGCMMIVVAVAHLIKCKIIVVMEKMEPTLLKLSRQRG